ncbi:vibriobactin export RND transporter periplasmic adaptor subunit VexG [Vibrio cholerae]|nr:vibriobactin export RND transporter periplasmic adaptor subunit VexG [Vibrio cholerae]
MNKNTVLSLTLLTLLMNSAVLSAKEPNQPPAISVVTESVQSQQISQSLSVVGKLKAEQSVDIAAEVAGKVDMIAVQANQQVKKGQILIKLDDDKAQAALVEAKAYLQDEQRKLTEYERLLKRNAITPTEIDAQRARVEIGQARLNAAQANLADLHITAPFDGTVGFIDFSRGKWVSAGSELLTLDNLSLMQLDLQIPERYLPQLSKGMKVQGSSEAWPNVQFEGSVVAVDSRINQETLNLRVRVHFPNPDQRLKPGMLMSARIHFPAISAPIIPVQALEYSGTKRFVYVIGEDNVAKRREVSLGARVENQVVIEKGLQIGEKIVVQGIVNMRDNARVSEVTLEGRPLKKDDK